MQPEVVKGSVGTAWAVIGPDALQVLEEAYRQAARSVAQL
jgi:hypothetical protein